MVSEITTQPDEVDQMEAALLARQLAGVDPVLTAPLKHIFVGGIYWREVFIPALHYAIGHKHRRETLNVLLSGKMLVKVDGETRLLEGPCVFPSQAGSRKVVIALTDCRFANIHATEETDIEKIESIMVEKSSTYLEVEAELRELKHHPILCPTSQ